jgi:hypothetical protein
MASELTTEVLDEVRMLAEQAGVGTESFGLLMTQNDIRNDGQPALVLLGSAGEGVLELLLTKWLGAEYSEALERAGTTPLILGPAPDNIPGKSRLIQWLSLKTDKLDKFSGQGHIIALQAKAAISNRLEGELTAFGYWNAAIVVSRASQPLPQREREFLQSLSRVVPAVTILLVAIPGELKGADDTTKIMEYVRAQAESNGFSGSRFGGAWLWWIDGDLHNTESAIKNPGEIISRRDCANYQARESLIRSAVVQLLQRIKKKAESDGVKSLPQLDDEELKKIGDDFLLRLERIKELSEDRFRDAATVTDNDVRAFVKNEMLGWESSKNIYAGPWLQYVDTIRPGTKAGLFRQMEIALETLTARPVSIRDEQTSPALMARSRVLLFVTHNVPAQNVLHISFAVLAGLGLWYVTKSLAYPSVVSAMAAILGGIAAFALRKPLMSFLRSTSDWNVIKQSPTTGARWEPPPSGRIENFNLFIQHLRDWLQRYISTNKIQVAARCDELLRIL